MNTEELEQSLRAEFEGQMNSAMAKMRQDVADLQKNYESEFEKHRSQMDEAFHALSTRLDSPFEFDAAFSESVVEHLRLARDEGAHITATAMGEAEKLGRGDADRDFEKLRDAIDEIKSNSTQAAILRALVDSAADFAQRGAFFIVKNDYLVGWKAYGPSELSDDNVVRAIHFPIASETLVSRAVSSLSKAQGSSGEDGENAKFLGPLSFGAPNKMYAIPLCARGRGVAVLYADGGESDEPVNLEALETLVSVAALRIELLAATAAEPVAAAAVTVAEPEITAVEYPVDAPVEELEETRNEFIEDLPATETYEVEYAGEVAVAEDISEPVSEFEAAPEDTESPVAEVYEEAVGATSDHAFRPDNFSEAAPAVEDESTYEEQETTEPEVEVAAEVQNEEQPAKSYRERNVDLPIEVDEDERRSHSDARRFARLLVSEIRLYNEQKVTEGRESGDIYESLKEAIDRSREMYEKRVQPEVSAKFDYFHYELVNNLADGEEEKLGAGYMAVKA